MKPSVLVIAIVALTLSGCFGYPPGSARPGDAVTVRYTATDLETGEVVAKDVVATFNAGSGASGLGVPFERSTVGLAANSTLRLESPASDGREYDQVVERPALLSEFNRTHTTPAPAFFAAFPNATVGFDFPASPVFNATVTAVNATTVTFYLAPSGSEPAKVPQYGLELVERTTATAIQTWLRPIVGTTFSVAGGLRELNLTAGSYKALESGPEIIRFGYHPGLDHKLLERDLLIEATVLAVHPAQGTTVAPDGNYGVRNSPQVLGVPGKTTLTQAPADDGHEHAH